MSLLKWVLLPAGIVVLGVLLVAAQDESCASAMDALWTAASDACIMSPLGYVCNGGGAPGAEPAGAVSNALLPVGAKVEAGEVVLLHTPPLAGDMSSTGIAWLRLQAPIQMTALLVGDVTIRDVTPPEFPAWASLVLQTSEEAPACAAAPHNAYIVQGPPGQLVRQVINGASLAFDGTVLVRTEGTNTVFAALSGQSIVTVFGNEQSLLTGQQISVPYNPGDFTRPAAPPGAATPFDPAKLQNLPVGLFDRPVVLPQPGYARTEGAVNLRSEPSLDAGVILQVQAGEVLSVLGQNPAGDWYHVRMDDGTTGWMLGELLQKNLGPIQAVYVATPLPPQRYGELGSAGRVLAPVGVNLRQGPDVGFPVIASVGDGVTVTLLARSPYSPWVKVDAGGVVGWVALITLETQAYIDALPVDYNVPQPPPPTQIPGSFGNAFPDPDGS